jgi:hypothetical protein
VTKESAENELASGLKAGELPGWESCAHAVGIVDSAHTRGIANRAAEHDRKGPPLKRRHKSQKYRK